MTEVVFTKTRGARTLRRREPVDGGFRWVEDGEEEFFYETVIDTEALGRLAQRAAGNVSGKAKDGALHIRVLSRRRVA